MEASGSCVLRPQVIYVKKQNHVWEGYDPDLLSYIDICNEYTAKLCFRVVKQLLVTGPSGRYFLVESDAGIRTLQSSLSSEFCVLQFFAVDESEDNVSALNIIYHKESCFVSVDVGTDCESGEEEDDDNEPVPSDYDSEELMREGLWKNSRKGLKMTCGHCGAIDHNKRRCPQLQRGAQTVQDVPLSAPQASQDSKISFMPLRALVDEDDDAEIDDEDEQPILRPKVISEAKTRFQRKKMHQPPTGSRKIGFRGDENGVSRPINLPYSPRKLGWRGEPCVTSNQLEVAKEKKIGKLKAKRGKH